MPVPWTDGTTPVNATNLEIMEADIAAVKVTADAAAPADAAHVAAADPHPQYQRETERGAANGYASLDASTLVPDVQIPPGIARDSEVAASIATEVVNRDAAIAAHAAAADPHTGYQKESERAVANGYASLDAGGKVPAAQLPTLGVADLAYKGAYSGATAYVDGDVVVYNGVLYLCVVPATGSAPEDWGVNQTIPDRLGTVAKQVTDWNLATENGWFMGSNLPNAPTAGPWYIGLVTVHNPIWITQRVFDFTSGTMPVPKYERRMTNGTWNAWTAVSN